VIFDGTPIYNQTQLYMFVYLQVADKTKFLSGGQEQNHP